MNQMEIPEPTPMKSHRCREANTSLGRLAQEEQSHASHCDQRPSHRLPTKAFLENDTADREHEDRGEGHQRTGHTDPGVLNGQQRR
jgi:hypothetical protein